MNTIFPPRVENIIKSFIDITHPNAIKYQVQYRMSIFLKNRQFVFEEYMMVQLELLRKVVLWDEIAVYDAVYVLDGPSQRLRRRRRYSSYYVLDGPSQRLRRRRRYSSYWEWMEEVD